MTLLFFLPEMNRQKAYFQLFNQPEKLKLLYQKIKTIELLLYLGKTELISSRRLSGYKTEQICVVRKIHEQLNQYYDAWLQYNNVYEEWAKAHGLSVNCLLVLCAICDSGDGCTQKKISQQWLIPKQTINMVSKDLQRKGFVKLSPLPEDKRNKVIRFTKEGKEYADTIVNALRKAVLSVIEEIGVEHMRQLNENMALFAKLFVKAGGINGNEAKP